MKTNRTQSFAQSCRPTAEAIAALAHQIYEREGRLAGHALDHWLAAEAQLTAERAKPAPSPTLTARPKTAAASDAALSRAGVGSAVQRPRVRPIALLAG